MTETTPFGEGATSQGVETAGGEYDYRKLHSYPLIKVCITVISMISTAEKVHM